ncbi:hypothetical protein EBS67_06265 [bacterium]|nr:hypothetical protein [bacterium]NBT61145.1 hypothetical protein [Planctomycetia bacterium]
MIANNHPLDQVEEPFRTPYLLLILIIPPPIHYNRKETQSFTHFKKHLPLLLLQLHISPLVPKISIIKMQTQGAINGN